MKIVKLIPFYLFLAYNVLLVSLFIVTYPDMMNYDMHWGYDGSGWGYKNKLNYTIMHVIFLMILIVPSVYALKKRKTNMKKAYIAVLIPLGEYLIRTVYFMFF